MRPDNLRLVQALIAAGSQDHIRKEGHIFHPPLVTVSRRYGAGGHRTANALAEALKVKSYDRELLDGIVESSNVDRYLMEQLDERVRGSMSDWAYTLITGKNAFSEDYRRHLFNLVLGIANRGGVILGRGAHLILADKPHVFRIRVTAPEDYCIKAIMAGEDLSEREARKKFKETNQNMEEFFRTLYKKEGILDSDFDLVINSARFSVGQIVDQVLHAMKSAKLLAP